MFDLIIQNFHKQHCKKKEKPEEQSNTTTPPKENVVVEIDYDKLAEALTKAEAKMQEEKQKKEKEEHEKMQIQWEKALKCPRYRGDKKILQFLDWLTRPFRIIFGLVTFRKKNATTENATYALFRICNEYLLSVYQYAFYFLTLRMGICIWNYDEFSKLFSIKIGGYVGLGILFFIIAQTIRVAKLEAANSQNKETITTIFNSIVSFTAMVFAVIAVIVTLMRGG